YEVLAAPHRIGILSAACQPAAGLPRWHTRERDDVVDHVPSLSGRQPLREGRHGARRESGGEPQPELLGVGTPAESPRSGQVTSDDRPAGWFFVRVARAAIETVAGGAAFAVEGLPALEARRVGPYARRHRNRHALVAGRAERADIAAHRLDLLGAEKVAEGRHRARPQAVADGALEIIAGGSHFGGRGLVLELSLDEVARPRAHGGRCRTVAAAVRTVARLAAAQVDALPQREALGRVGARGPGDAGEFGGVGFPPRPRVCVSQARPERSPGVEGEKRERGEDQHPRARDRHRATRAAVFRDVKPATTSRSARSESRAGIAWIPCRSGNTSAGCGCR